MLQNLSKFKKFDEKRTVIWPRDTQSLSNLNKLKSVQFSPTFVRDGDLTQFSFHFPNPNFPKVNNAQSDRKHLLNITVMEKLLFFCSNSILVLELFSSICDDFITVEGFVFFQFRLVGPDLSSRVTLVFL